MNIWSITLQNIKKKPLYTFLSVFVLSLSITLLLGIQQLKLSFKNQIENNVGKIDLVIGAKGSPLQLILASVLHIDNPIGNISYAEAMKLSKNPMIQSAIPISYGDNYKGFRIIGTTNEYLSLYNGVLEKGRNVEKSMEVVLGNIVAEKLNIKIGDRLLSSHGLIENTIDIHEDEFTVVGILKPTRKVIDHLIITNLESVWAVHHHENHSEDHEHHHHEVEKEITSLLINFKSTRALLSFPRKINKRRPHMMAALPKLELNKLYEYTSIGFYTISWLAYFILIISCCIIFISLYKMVKERAFDLAILRTYGATNFQLIKMIFYEGFMIVFSAFIIGVILLKIGFYVIFYFIASTYKYNVLQELPFQDLLQTIMIIFMVVILSVSLAIYPIIKMNIATILSNEK